ncbi:MAG: FG-GAP-like repeat-containing protein [Candidatus Eisenbacteria bacterium]|nr:FG-GAP-like repeat-containing protein [Candidatus Eisenbacteria bacterium]
MIGHRPARAASRRWFQPLPLLLVPSTLLALVLGLCLGLGLDARTAGADALREAFLTVREGNANDANIGASVGTAGDVNGDGYSDVLLNSRENNGTVRCYLGGRDLDFSAPAWTATGGAQPNAWLGCRVSTAGDVNGDGYDDVLIGAPIYSDGQLSEGAVFVYLGSSSGLSPTPHKVLQQDVALAGFGSSVDTAGDANGDGYDDVVVGAPNYGSGQAQEGRVYVYLGSSSGMHAQPSWSFESNVSGAYLGQRVAGSADVNADGYDDLLVSAPDLANGQASEGRVYLFLGSPSGLGAGPAWTYESNTAGGRCGWGLGCAGDVNADGYSDIVFDTGSNNPATGAVLIFFGGPNVPGAVANRVFPSNQGAFGDVIYTAGDVNGDGSSDLIASEVSANNFTGRITILGGSETAAAPPVLALRDGQQAEEAFATDARPAGDVNGDGYGDVIVGAPRFESGPVHIDEGIVRLYLGQATAPASQPAWFPMGVQWNAQYGAAVAQGDWNGDGLTDLAFGAPWYDVEETDCGAVTIYYGNEAGYTVAANQFLSGEIENELLGFSLANAGDVDNDGYDDLVVGAPSYGSLDWPNVGAAFLYKGSATGLSGTPSWSVSGGILPCQFGWSVSGAGDVNSDGFADVIVGAPQYSFSPEVGGKAFLFFGSASGLSYVTAWTGSGNADGDAYGSSVAGIGDVNGDGYGDIAVGSPGLDDGQTDEGAFHVFFGSPEGIEGSWTVEGNANFVQYGYEVAAGGDLNGDGLSDLLHGAPFFDGDGLINCGIAEAYLGTPGNTLTRVWQQRGGSTGDFYGYSLAGGGDANDDGYSDVLVGAPTAAGTRGECYLYLGQAGGLGAAPVWGANGGDPAGSFGTGLSIAGDVTGDGFALSLIHI